MLPELRKVYVGDCLTTMEGWPDSSVDCTVTSPPYFGLRSYLPKGHASKPLEIGCGQTLEEYLAILRLVFGEARRITKPTGTMWVNIGETYRDGLMLRVPNLVADAAIAAGWRLVSEVIWHKPNCQTTSSRVRCTPAHESVFQFAKTKGYYFDPFPLMERSKYQHDPLRELKTHARSVWTVPTESLNGRKLMADLKFNGTYRELNPLCLIHGDSALAGPLFLSARLDVCTCPEVEADFFAAMPTELARRCILCSTSEGGNCAQCGVPYDRMISRERVATRPGADVKVDPAGKANKDPKRHVSYVLSAGWKRPCDCSGMGAIPTQPVVFDPFLGSGTTAVAAELSGRNWLGCELNPMLAEKLIPARLKAAWRKAK